MNEIMMVHDETQGKVRLVTSYKDGEHRIHHFYSKQEQNRYVEINTQVCRYEPTFNCMWEETINAYLFKGWRLATDEERESNNG